MPRDLNSTDKLHEDAQVRNELGNDEWNEFYDAKSGTVRALDFAVFGIVLAVVFMILYDLLDKAVVIAGVIALAAAVIAVVVMEVIRRKIRGY